MGAWGGSPDTDWFVQLADGSDLVFYVLRVEPDVGFEFVSEAVESLIGCTCEEAIADPQAVLGQIEPAYASRLADALALPPGNSAWAELVFRHRDGRAVFNRIWTRSRRRADGSVVLEGTARDQTRLREAEIELRRSEERYRLMAENAWDVIWTADLDGTLTYISPAVERIRGVTPEEAARQPIDEIYPPESAAEVRDYFRRLREAIRAGRRPPVFRGERRYYRRDGSIMTGEVQVIPHVDADGRVLEILGVSRDISERKAFEAELRRLAVTDPVTGVWNRRHGEELLAADVTQALRHGRAMSLLMLDIDRFKTINDSYGHQTGDHVLIETARRLAELLRGTDLVARWGGEEFVILLRDCVRVDAVSIAEKIRTGIADTSFADVGAVKVSIGVAELRPGDDLTSWLARADSALYEAKRSGRNAVRAAK